MEAQTVPAKLYKYRSMAPDLVKWVESIVLRNELFFAAAKTFNDPFELQPVFSLAAAPSLQQEKYLAVLKKRRPHLTSRQLKAEVNKAMKSTLHPDNIEFTQRVIQHQIAELMLNSIGVLCVTSKPDDVLMWSHYADSHKGICLEFDGSLPLASHPMKVMYSEKRPIVNPHEDTNDTRLEKSLLTKSDHWAYENEWRLIDHENGPGVVKFLPEYLTGIIVGANASISTIDLVKSWAKKREKPLNLHPEVRHFDG